MPNTAIATPDTRALIARRHVEWRENQLRWRFLQDSLEGGDRYRFARYGQDTRHRLPIMNLVRHKREYPAIDKNSNMTAGAYNPGVVVDFSATGGGGGDAEYWAQHGTDDDFSLRLIRTPVPTFVGEAVGRHLNRIFSREVKRDGPADLAEWWDNVDGCGTTVDQWISKDVGPLLLTLGQLDILFDRPPADGPINTKADEAAAGVEAARASIVLPQNMLWWTLDARRRYSECLVLEWTDGDDGDRVQRFRHWTPTDWTLYDVDAKTIGTGAHPYGRPPIVRVFDRRKVRSCNVGASEYEAVAEYMREYYNRDSELILSDTTQAHPLLSGPEDFCQADGTLDIGPSWLLPKKKINEGGQTTYATWDYVDAPKGAAESIRQNKHDIRDVIDRHSAMNKPAGSSGGGGSGGGTVHQSGISKAFDNQDLNDLLTRRCQTLERAELRFAELAMLVIGGGPRAAGAIDLDDPDDEVAAGIKVMYPTEFDLHSADDLAKAVAEIQGVIATSGTLPETEFDLITRLVRLALPGLADERYAKLDAEIKAYLDDAHERHQQGMEANMEGLNVTLNNMVEGGTVAPAVPQIPGAPAKGASGPPTVPAKLPPPRP